MTTCLRIKLVINLEGKKKQSNLQT